MNTELMMQNLTKGDPDAFQQFYDRYSLPVYHYIMDKTGDPERTRQLWRDTFRGLLSMLRCSDPPDLPFLLLTALADRQLDATPAPADHATSKPSPDSGRCAPVSGHEAPPAKHSPSDSGPVASVSEAGPSPLPDDTSPTPGSMLPPQSGPDAVPAPTDAPSPESAVSAASPGNASASARTGARRTGLICLLVVLILVGIFALWTATGYLMALDVLPAYDLGYSWFNRVFFRLFPSSFP